MVARVCAACGGVGEFAPGPNGRAEARCRDCGSYERHRFLALLLELAAPRVLGSGALLDVAPSRCLTPRLRELGGERYAGVDFDPAADGRQVELRASLTALPFAAGAADLVVAYHVLEHIPDDAAAMAELARVLRPGGLAVVQVPWRPGPTDEDPSASAEERTRRFGQADHVRFYGDTDVEDRLAAAGLAAQRFVTGDVTPAAIVERFRLKTEEPVWLCHPAGSEPALTPGDVRDGWAGSLTVALGRVAERAAAASRERAAAVPHGVPGLLRAGYGRLPASVRARVRQVRR